MSLFVWMKWPRNERFTVGGVSFTIVIVIAIATVIVIVVFVIVIYLINNDFLRHKQANINYKSKAPWAAHGWIVDFCLWQNESFCQTICMKMHATCSFILLKIKSLHSPSCKSSHFHVKCFARAFVLKRGKSKKQLWSGSKVGIWAQWPIRLAVIPVSVT